MEQTTRNKSTVRAAAKRGFEYDLEELKEYAKPAPAQDREGRAIADFLSQLFERAQTGYVVDWRPPWLLECDPFKYFYFEDKLVVDTFSAPGGEIDIMEDIPGIEDQIGRKSALCVDHGLTYVPVRPDADLDTVQLAARLGKAKVKRKEEEKT